MKVKESVVLASDFLLSESGSQTYKELPSKVAHFMVKIFQRAVRDQKRDLCP